MHSQNFVNLRTHTNYSLSEGMLTANYIADFCVNDMQPACAITLASRTVILDIIFILKKLLKRIR